MMPKPVIKKKVRPVIKKPRMSKESVQVLKVIASYVPAPKRPVIQKPGPPEDATVFVDHSRRIFIALGDNRYITTRDEEIRIVKLDDGVRARDDRGQLKTQETKYLCDLVPLLINGKPYPRVSAAQKFFDTRNTKASEAVRELCRILDKPIPKPSVEEVVKREALHKIRVKQAAHAREVRAEVRKDKIEVKEEEKGARELWTPAGYPTSEAIVTVVKRPPRVDKKYDEVLTPLKKAGGSLTAGDIRKICGHSIGTLIKHLLKLHAVKLS